MSSKKSLDPWCLCTLLPSFFLSHREGQIGTPHSMTLLPAVIKHSVTGPGYLFGVVICALLPTLANLLASLWSSDHQPAGEGGRDRSCGGFRVSEKTKL